MGVNLQFNSMADLEPAAIARQVPAMAKLLEAREQLANLQKYMSSKPAAQKQIQELLNDPDLLKTLADRAAEDAEDEDKGGDDA
jgi:type VI secretion system protein ImpB